MQSEDTSVRENLSLVKQPCIIFEYLHNFWTRLLQYVCCWETKKRYHPPRAVHAAAVVKLYLFSPFDTILYWSFGLSLAPLSSIILPGDRWCKEKCSLKMIMRMGKIMPENEQQASPRQKPTPGLLPRQTKKTWKDCLDMKIWGR